MAVTLEEFKLNLGPLFCSISHTFLLLVDFDKAITSTEIQ